MKCVMNDNTILVYFANILVIVIESVYLLYVQQCPQSHIQRCSPLSKCMWGYPELQVDHSLSRCCESKSQFDCSVHPQFALSGRRAD